MMPHEDEAQDASMIEQVLQKIIDEMHGMEANRIHPKAVDVSMSMGGIAKPNEDTAETIDQAEPENQDNQHGELDPNVLKELMDKAGSVDDSGAAPDDHMDELPAGLADIIRKKKMM